jgi:hypothetical protein
MSDLRREFRLEIEDHQAPWEAARDLADAISNNSEWKVIEDMSNDEIWLVSEVDE